MGESLERTLHTVFFSPTHGTMHAFDQIAACFMKAGITQVKRHNQILPRMRAQRLAFGPNDLVMVGAPTYVGVIPQVKGLFSNLEGNQTPCVVIATYGDRASEHAAHQLATKLERQGFVVVGAMTPIIPHVSCPLMGKGRPNEEDRRIFQEFADKVMASLERKASVADRLPGDADPELPQRPPTPREHLEDRCTWCMSCVDGCPLACIDPRDFTVDYDLCISCQRCAFVCRYGAWVFDNSAVRERVQGNYTGPKQVEYWV